jgi:hypothetical protein
VYEVGAISSPGDVVSFLREAFPQLRVERVVVLGEGWDSFAFLVNEAVVFRIPKRPAVARQMAYELAILRSEAKFSFRHLNPPFTSQPYSSFSKDRPAR